MFLSAQVKKEEIELAVDGISDKKAPGRDDFNTYFFKKTWPIIGADVIQAVLKFIYVSIHPSINCTMVTLIPKVANPTDLSLVAQLYTR